MQKSARKIVIKIGGSLLYHNKLKLNMSIISKVMSWFNESQSKYDKIIIVVGGGQLSRYMGDLVRPMVGNKDDLHGVAMQSTMVNAQLIKEILDNADEEIVVPKSLGEAFELVWDDSVKAIITGGLKKGWSTDMDAAVLADAAGVDRVYKLSDVEGIYSDDPDKNKSARLIKNMTWKEYFDQFGIVVDFSEHKPNVNIPIDVLAAQFCFRKEISFFVSGGTLIDDNEVLGAVFEEGTYITAKS
ncbi:hypothetical protein GF357_00870 [Candidatus Dojkabacteria bacterium]|nr:hypothetical protein [Candidatus Dojkabacteria bacterium]